MDQLDLFAKPRLTGFAPVRHDPVVWVKRLLILREPKLDSVVRDIHLHRGLNILWARPFGPGEARLNEGRLSGHTAGKTTFCRLIRYVLGEERFAAPRVQERMRTGDLRDGWVIGEVVVAGQPWVVGRPFALYQHPFASRGESVEEALSVLGPFQEFKDALAAATTAKLHVARLPSSGTPIDWPLLLAWLTRDQEARFSGVEDWRSARSESTSPNPPAVDRGAVLRAVLDLLSDEEATLQRKWAELDRSKEDIERKASGAGVIVTDRRKRLAHTLGIKQAGTIRDLGGAGPAEGTSVELEEAQGLFDPATARIEERKKAAARALSHLAEVEPSAAEAARARDESARERDELSGQLKALRKRSEAAERRRGTAILHVAAAPDRDTDVAEMDRDIELGPPSPGRCNVPLHVARERGCPLAEEAPPAAVVPLRRRPASESDSGPDIAMEHAPENAMDRGPEIDPAVEPDVEEIAAAHAHAEQVAAEKAEAARRWAESLAEARAQAAEEQTRLRDIERLVQELRAAEKEVEEVAREAALRASKMESVTDQRSVLRKAHQAARERLSRRFESILKSLLGDQMGGEVLITRDGIEPVVKERGDRESAAMDTVKVIAFDLAALTLGFEGHGHFPGFLLHDGPREADMDQAIYDRLFLYARTMEEAFPSPGSIGFQYIVTTTTAPPASMRTLPWLLDPVLDASTPEGRLLGMDL